MNAEWKKKQHEIIRLKTQIQRLFRKIDPDYEDLEQRTYDIMHGPIVVRRAASGSFLSSNMNHKPGVVRCVHYQEDTYIPCDCRHVGPLYVLSKRAKNLKRLGLLKLDESILDQQREAIKYLLSDQIVPNTFNIIRDFDLVMWKHWSNIKKTTLFGNPTWKDLVKEMDIAKLKKKIIND